MERAAVRVSLSAVFPLSTLQWVEEEPEEKEVEEEEEEEEEVEEEEEEKKKKNEKESSSRVYSSPLDTTLRDFLTTDESYSRDILF